MAAAPWPIPVHGVRGNHQADDRVLVGHMPLQPLEIVEGRGGFVNAGELDQDAVLIGQFLGKPRGVHEILAGHEHLDPVIGRGQRHLDLGDDPVGAVGVGHARQFFAAEFQHPRLFLHGHDAQPDDVAEIAQGSPGAGEIGRAHV